MTFKLVSAAIVALALVTTCDQAQAMSKAAQWLVKQQVKQGCETKSGKFDPASVIERDLTGDGKADLVIDHGGLTCSDGGLRLHCGVRACSVLVYVRNGKLLELSKEILSIGAEVTGGNPPSLKLMSHDFSSHSIRWNGKSFE